MPPTASIDPLRVHFIGGVHGVGKSTVCLDLQAALGCDYARAGDLLKFASMTDDPTGKAVADVQGNQDRLVAALRQRTDTGKSLLLDGHFCVLDGDRRPAPIPLATFRGIAPRSLLLVEETASTILQRLERRGGGTFQLSVIEDLLACERTQATAVAADLAVPLRIISSGVAVADLAAYLNAIEEPGQRLL